MWWTGASVSASSAQTQWECPSHSETHKVQGMWEVRAGSCLCQLRWEQAEPCQPCGMPGSCAVACRMQGATGPHWQAGGKAGKVSDVECSLM